MGRPEVLQVLHQSDWIALDQRKIDAFAEIIRQAAPGRFDEARARPATMAMLGMINFTFAWLRPDGRMTYEQYAELVCDIVVNGLAPAPDCAARASA